MLRLVMFCTMLHLVSGYQYSVSLWIGNRREVEPIGYLNIVLVGEHKQSEAILLDESKVRDSDVLTGWMDRFVFETDELYSPLIGVEVSLSDSYTGPEVFLADVEVYNQDTQVGQTFQFLGWLEAGTEHGTIRSFSPDFNVQRSKTNLGHLMAKLSFLSVRASHVYNNHRYFLSARGEASSVQDAIAQCEAIGGFLAEIDSREEYDFVTAFLDKQAPDVYYVFISGTDEAGEGRWVHQRTGREVGYNQWVGSEPDGGTRANCVYLRQDDPWGRHDYECGPWDLPDTFLCEVPE